MSSAEKTFWQLMRPICHFIIANWDIKFSESHHCKDISSTMGSEYCSYVPI